MAKLTPYFAENTDTQRPVEIWAKIGAFLHVGSGNFEAFDDYSVRFSGTGQGRQLTIALRLTDQDPAARNGPCAIQVNETSDDHATYSVAGDAITITSGTRTVTVRRCEGGKQTEIVRHPPVQANITTFHLKQVAAQAAV